MGLETICCALMSRNSCWRPYHCSDEIVMKGNTTSIVKGSITTIVVKIKASRISVVILFVLALSTRMTTMQIYFARAFYQITMCLAPLVFSKDIQSLQIGTRLELFLVFLSLRIAHSKYLVPWRVILAYLSLHRRVQHNKGTYNRRT